MWTEDRVVGGRRGRGWPVGASWDTRARSQPSAALFEACCGDHIQPFDDEEDDDIWEDKEAHCTARVTARARCAAPPPSPSVPQEQGAPGWCHAPALTGLPRFGGPQASENSLAPGVRAPGEAGTTVARAGTPPATAQKEGSRVDYGPEGGC